MLCFTHYASYFPRLVQRLARRFPLRLLTISIDSRDEINGSNITSLEIRIRNYKEEALTVVVNEPIG
jgi:hypothetical protein